MPVDCCVGIMEDQAANSTHPDVSNQDQTAAKDDVKQEIKGESKPESEAEDAGQAAPRAEGAVKTEEAEKADGEEQAPSDEDIVTKLREFLSADDLDFQQVTGELSIPYGMSCMSHHRASGCASCHKAFCALGSMCFSTAMCLRYTDLHKDATQSTSLQSFIDSGEPNTSSKEASKYNFVASSLHPAADLKGLSSFVERQLRQQLEQHFNTSLKDRKAVVKAEVSLVNLEKVLDAVFMMLRSRIVSFLSCDMGKLPYKCNETDILSFVFM